MPRDESNHMDVHAVGMVVKVLSFIAVVCGVVSFFMGSGVLIAAVWIASGLSSFLFAGLVMAVVEIESHIRSLRRNIPEAAIAPTPPLPSSNKIKV